MPCQVKVKMLGCIEVGQAGLMAIVHTDGLKGRVKKSVNVEAILISG